MTDAKTVPYRIEFLYVDRMKPALRAYADTLDEAKRQAYREGVMLNPGNDCFYRGYRIMRRAKPGEICETRTDYFDSTNIDEPRYDGRWVILESGSYKYRPCPSVDYVRDDDLVRLQMEGYSKDKTNETESYLKLQNERGRSKQVFKFKCPVDKCDLDYPPSVCHRKECGYWSCVYGCTAPREERQ